MPNSVLDAAHFHDEEAAYAYVETRLWPNGPECPHCGTVDNAAKLAGKSTRIGVYKCREKECRRKFTVKVNTIFHDSHIPMHIWLQGIHLMAASKKGFSANQFARTLGVALKNAWHMAHRIREAMREGDLVPFGKDYGGVEADETFFGQNPNVQAPVGTPLRNMNRVMTLVDRDSGKARSFVMEEFTVEAVGNILRENVAKEAFLLTDEAAQYRKPGERFTFHGRVNHAQKEYVRKDAPWVHSNTVESYFSVFKRGMRGTYQHCARRHLHRYCAEFDFRYSHRIALGVGDQERADRILVGVRGKRLSHGPTDKGRTGTDTV
jgi:transposase-like protein